MSRNANLKNLKSSIELLGETNYTDLLFIYVAQSSTEQPTTDIREKDITVMKKRVVSVEQEEDFQVIAFPLIQIIDTKYQDLKNDGKSHEEALAILMDQVKSSEMPTFMEWLNCRSK